MPTVTATSAMGQLNPRVCAFTSASLLLPIPDIVSDRSTTMPKTAMQIAGALFGVVALCGALLAVTLWTLHEQRSAEVGLARLDRAKHMAHRVEAQFREQYIHQAHSVIERGLGHLHHYKDAVRATRQAIDALSRLSAPADEARVRLLSRLARRSDAHFRHKIVPAIRGSTARSTLVELHARAEAIVTRATGVNAALSETLSRRSELARETAAALRRRTRAMAYGCFVLASLVALTLAWLLARRIGRRIVAVRDGARELSRGDLGARVELTGDDEFAELAATFNAMASALADHQKRLLRAERLASVGKVAAGVAHEINNPLAVILGYVHLLRRHARDDQRESIDIIEQEVKLSQRIVEGLLDLARPDRLEARSVDLGDLASGLVERLRAAKLLDDCAVAITCEETPLVVEADRGKLEQLLTNVVVNAAQAGAERIDVTLQRRGSRAVIVVDDDGPGMDARVRSRALDPFFTTKRDGAGLGLAIVNAIVEAHDGELELDRSDRGGTTVRVILPGRQRGAR